MLSLLLPYLPSAAVFSDAAVFVAVCAALHALVLATVTIPGAVVLMAAGLLAVFSDLRLADLVWAGAAGNLMGGQISFFLGRLARRGGLDESRWGGAGPLHGSRRILQDRGGLGVLVGRLPGPMAGFVPFAAGLADMAQGRFIGWNLAGAIFYAAVYVLAGAALAFVVVAVGAGVPPVIVVSLAAMLALVAVAIRVWRTRRAMALLRAILVSVVHGIALHPWAQPLLTRYARQIAWLRRKVLRVTAQNAAFAALAVLLFYVGVAYAESVTGFLSEPRVAAADTHLANLFYALRDDRVIAVLGWITQMGGPDGVLPLLAGATLALLVLRRFDLLSGLWIAAIGNQITVTVLKGFFARPRSDLGYYVETSGSFPSGHAAASVAVIGMLFYLAWRLRLLRAVVALIAAVLVAAVMGISRIYLVVHYVSDVLNGYLVGALWFILGVAWCEWQRGPRQSLATARRRIAGGVMIAAVVLAMTLAAWRSPAQTLAADQMARTLSDLSDVAVGADWPAVTQTLTGRDLQPVNLVAVATGPDPLTAALAAVGWQAVPRPGAGSLLDAMFDHWAGNPVPQPLVIPTFWNNRPSTLGFDLPQAAGDPPLHLRFWDSLARTPQGGRVFVGALVAEHPLTPIMPDVVAVNARPALTAEAVERTRAALAAAGIATQRP